MIKNLLYLIGSFAIFFLGIILYGVFLSKSSESLSTILAQKNIKEIVNPKIIVTKSKYNLALYSDATLLKNYKVVLGRVVSDKIKLPSTPAGKYRICEKVDNFKYHKLLRLNFPNSSNASELLMENKISKSEYKKIIQAENDGICPPEEIEFIKNFGIQGIGKYDLIFKNMPFVFNWTNGSVAVSNENIDELFSVCEVGTEVIIRE